MKKITLSAIAVLVVSPFPALASEGASTGSRGTEFIIMGGISAATVTSETDSQGVSKTAKSVSPVSLGVFGEYSFNPRAAVSLGMQYVGLGASGDATFLGTPVKFEDQSRYFSIPIQIKYIPYDQGGWRGYARGGIAPAFLSSYKTRVTLGADSQELDSKSAGTVKKTDFFALLGVGGSYDLMSNLSMIVDLGYLRGLTNVDATGKQKYYNTAYQFNAGISLKI